MEQLVYLGTNSVRGSKGIYTGRLNHDTGLLRLCGTTPAQDAGYLSLAPDGQTLYATIESMLLNGKAQGGVAAYRIDSEGLPVLINTEPAQGQLICHVSCDRHNVYASSYLNGTVTVFPRREDGGLLAPSHVIRHAPKEEYLPHIHCAVPTPDGKYLCVVEVGYHALCLYDLVSFEKVYEIRTRPVRPRQVVCTPQCIYLLTEGGMTVDEYAYSPEPSLCLRQSLSCLPEGFRGMGGAGGIRLSPDGKTLFASIRGVDVTAVFSVDENGHLEKISVTKLCGSTPRDFGVAADGKHLLIGLQKSDAMAVYRFDGTEIHPVQEGIHVPSCSCVEFGRCIP